MENGWLFEAGIGENRALLFERGEAVAVRLEREQAGPRAGAILDAKFVRQWVAGRSGIAQLAGGGEALLQPLPSGLTEGASLRVQVVREAISERQGQVKRARVRPVAADAELTTGPGLFERLQASGRPVQQLQPHDDDLLAQYGWHEIIEQAQSGQVEFDGGTLLIAQTPAMTVIDVDGPLAAAKLAKRAAREIALALRRLDITGNIGIDFPTMEAKADRNAVAEIFDAHMTSDCERTAINGFGFMQVISRKRRPSVLEIVQASRPAEAALALLRRAERDRGSGALQLDMHPAVAANLRPEWREELSRRTGRPVEIVERGNLAIGGEQIR